MRTLTPITAAEIHAANPGADYCGLVGSGATPERVTRKRRSKAEQQTNPYEFTIQCRVVRGLRLLLPLDYIVQANVQEATGGNAVAGFWARAMGQEKGWPDVGVHGDGREWLIECKDLSGRLSKDQIAMHARITLARIPLLPICRSLDEAVAFLQASGARFRGRISA